MLAWGIGLRTTVFEPALLFVLKSLTRLPFSPSFGSKQILTKILSIKKKVLFSTSDSTVGRIVRIGKKIYLKKERQLLICRIGLPLLTFQPSVTLHHHTRGLYRDRRDVTLSRESGRSEDVQEALRVLVSE